MPADHVTDLEIDAYIDGELDLERRLAVEDHLARSPEAAQRAMADMRARTALRLAQAPQGDVPQEMRDAAERLTARLVVSAEPLRLPRARGLLPLWSRGRSAAALMAAGTVGLVMMLPPSDVSARPPAYVADAVEAFQTGLLRAAMPSQKESLTFDAGDIRRSTRIRVPALPIGWRITDVQIFPSDEGPALQIMARTSTGEPVSIFAVRNPIAAPAHPVTVRHGDASVAYWRTGDIAYALTGTDTPAALDIVAEDIADNHLVGDPVMAAPQPADDEPDGVVDRSDTGEGGSGGDGTGETSAESAGVAGPAAAGD